MALKTALLCLCVWFIGTHIYTFDKATGTMAPSFQTGDLVIGFTLERDYTKGMVVTYEDCQYRIIATEGDVVDLKDGVLYINDVPQDESYAEGMTYALSGGISYPIEVQENEGFLLGDNRMYTEDSRLFGCVSLDEITSKVIAVLRQRNI